MNLTSLQNRYAQKAGYKDWSTMVKRNNLYEMEVHWRKLSLKIQESFAYNVCRELTTNFSKEYEFTINKIVKNRKLLIK